MGRFDDYLASEQKTTQPTQQINRVDSQGVITESPRFTLEKVYSPTSSEKIKNVEKGLKAQKTPEKKQAYLDYNVKTKYIDEIDLGKLQAKNNIFDTRPNQSKLVNVSRNVNNASGSGKDPKNVINEAVKSGEIDNNQAENLFKYYGIKGTYKGFNDELAKRNGNPSTGERVNAFVQSTGSKFVEGIAGTADLIGNSIDNVTGLNKTPNYQASNIAQDFTNQKEVADETLFKGLDKGQTTAMNVALGAVDIASMFIPYGVANKVLEGVPAITKIVNTFKSPLVGKLVKNAVIGTIANTAISTPQIINKGINDQDSALKILGDVGLDAGFNLLIDTAFAGIGEIFTVKNAKKAFESGKINEQEFTDIVGKEAQKIADTKKSEIEAMTAKVTQDIPTNTIDTSPLQASQTQPIQSDIVSPNEVKNAATSPIEGVTNTPANEFKIDTEQGQEVRSVSDRLMKDNTQPEQVRKLISEDVNSKYEVYTNEKATLKAEEFINKYDDDLQAVVGIRERIDAGKYDKGDIVAGIHLYEKIKVSNPEMAEELMADMAIKATEAGQIAQAFSMLKTLSSKGYEYSLKKQIDKLNAELVGKFTKFKSIEIDDNMKALLKQRAEATTEETKNEIGDLIQKYIGSKIPTSNLDKIIAFRHMAMLSNPKTHIKNIVGNAIMKVVSTGKDTLATGFEKIPSLVSKDQRTKFIGWQLRNPEIKSTVDNAYKKAIESGEFNGNKYADNSFYKEQKTFTGGKDKPNIIDKALQKSQDTIYKGLDFGDNIFIEGHFKNYLGQFMSARGLKKATPEAVEYAVNQAKKLTYRDDSKLVDAINKFSNSSKGAKVLIDVVAPFRKTPVNIAKRTFEYSPFGLVEELTNGINQVVKGKKSISELIDGISAGVTGTAIASLGIWAYSSGILTGKPNDNKDLANYDKAVGKQPFAFKIGDTYVSYDWASPVGSMIAAGAAIAEAMKDDQDLFNTITSMTAAEADSLFNSSVFKGMVDTIAGRYGSEISDVGLNAGSSFVLSFFPSIVNSIGKTIDDTTRTTTYEGDNKFKADILNKLPLANQTLEPKITTKGDPIVENNIWKGFKNFLIPANITESTVNKADEEIQKIYNITGEKGIIPNVTPKYFINGEKYTLTPREATEFQKVQGKATYEGISNLLTGNDYRAKYYKTTTKDSDKSKLIKMVVDESYEKAKRNLVEKRGKKYR